MLLCGYFCTFSLKESLPDSLATRKEPRQIDRIHIVQCESASSNGVVSNIPMADTHASCSCCVWNIGYHLWRYQT